MALYKLEEDNYAYELVNEDDKKISIWSITIYGTLFHGYVGTEKELTGLIKLSMTKTKVEKFGST